MKKIISLIILLTLSHCATPTQIANMYKPQDINDIRTIYVHNNGWHAGIVLNITDIPSKYLLEKSEFREANYLEIGWGEAGFYQAEEITPLMAVKALFWLNSSVMHLVGFNIPVEQYFPANEIVAVNISEKGLNKLLEYIDGSFARDKNGRSIYLGHGLYGDSKFYQANKYYFALYTYNSWTAYALKEAGVPITPFYSLHSSLVMQQVKPHGKVIR